VALLTPYTGSQAHVVIEEAQAMPGQGVRSMFTCGLGLGVWLGVLAALGCPYTRVRPQIWKRAFGLGKDRMLLHGLSYRAETSLCRPCLVATQLECEDA
jgi:hypothetical protein